MTHQITDNFWSHEIFKPEWDKISVKSQFLAEYLCKRTLQPLRDTDPDVVINVTRGASNSSDIARLIKQGYFPSSTTDHFFGDPQKIFADNEKIRLYGNLYSFSVGAVDIVPVIPQNEKNFIIFFQKMVILNEMGIIKAGQIILEKGKYTYWIHVSNPVSLVYGENFIGEMRLQRNKYLTSLNNDGKYKIFMS